MPGKNHETCLVLVSPAAREVLKSVVARRLTVSDAACVISTTPSATSSARRCLAEGRYFDDDDGL
jgi:hypothetical protein